MRSVYLHTAALTFWGASAAAQNWAPLGQPGVVAGTIQEVNANADHTALYLCGAFDLDTSPGWQASNAVLRYAGGEWDTLGTINGLVNSVVQYGDTVVAGGSFLQVNGSPLPYITCRANGPWQAFGNFDGSIRRLRVIDGVLYAVGSFTTIDGQLVNGVAKRVGGTWHPVGPAGSLSEPLIVDVCSFNGDIVIVGNLYVNGAFSRIAVFNGTDWAILGPGIMGSFSAARCLAVFESALYLGGQIHTSEGNAGQNIMRWNGSTFESVGDGLWLQYGVQSTATVNALVVRDSLLFVGGGFRFAGTMPVDGLVAWNGERWCRVPGTISSEANGLYSMEFIGDTLAISTLNDTLDGQFTNYAAKFIGESYADTCSGALSVQEFAAHPSVAIHPNPASTNLTVEWRTSTTGVRQGAELILLDGTGRQVLRVPLLQRASTIAVDHLTAGTYLAVITLEGEVAYHQPIVVAR